MKRLSQNIRFSANPQFKHYFFKKLFIINHSLSLLLEIIIQKDQKVVCSFGNRDVTFELFRALRPPESKSGASFTFLGTAYLLLLLIYHCFDTFQNI